MNIKHQMQFVSVAVAAIFSLSAYAAGSKSNISVDAVTQVGGAQSGGENKQNMAVGNAKSGGDSKVESKAITQVGGAQSGGKNEQKLSLGSAE